MNSVTYVYELSVTHVTDCTVLCTPLRRARDLAQRDEAQRRAAGTWRSACPDCLKKRQQALTNKKPKPNPPSDEHAIWRSEMRFNEGQRGHGVALVPTVSRSGNKLLPIKRKKQKQKTALLCLEDAAFVVLAVFVAHAGELVFVDGTRLNVPDELGVVVDGLVGGELTH